MTLWQDNQPQTRREARERERAAALEKNKSGGRNESRAAPAQAETPQPAEQVDRSAAPTERESESRPVPAGVRGGDPSAENGAPLVADHFAASVIGGSRGTARPQLPNYETSFDALLSPDADAGPSGAEEDLDGVDDPAPSSEGSAAEEEPAEKLRRLFGPRTGDRSEESAASLYRDAAATGEVEPVTAPVSLVPDSVRPSARAGGPTPEAPSAQPAAAQPAATPTPEVAATPPERDAGSPALFAAEKTMTRRELRAMLQAEQSRRGSPSTGAGNVAESGADAFGLDTAAQAKGSASSERAAGPDPTPPTVAFTATPPIPGHGSSVTPPSRPAAAPVRDDAADADLDGRTPFEPPVGHWSRAGETDRRNEAFDQILSRGVGPSGGATTTSALILPSIPTAPPTTGPITATGEILVTGSIDLPRGLGSTGQHPDRYDTSEMDRMFDQAEGEMNTADVEPIRASHAVSGHTSTRGVITPPKKSHGRLPLILSITAGVLLVAVVGLLVAGYVLKVF